MDKTKGLSSYIKRQEYRKALGLPEAVSEEYIFLAQGEYNRNYVFRHTDGRKLVLRINLGSQLGLDKQITYEYDTLQLLSASKRTPKPIYLDDSRKYIDYGILVMEFLEGDMLDYAKDLKLAAEILADIHSVELPAKHHLIIPKDPEEEVLKEAKGLLSVYYNFELASDNTKKRLEAIFTKTEKLIKSKDLRSSKATLINTELNSSNFLVSETEGYLVDWEKAIHAEVAQDLAHFLAPTTTFWKTDIILDKRAMDEFLEDYIGAVDKRFDTRYVIDRTYRYIPINCLRGVSWCSYAWVQYQKADKAILNESTRIKLDAYLENEFLDMIYAV